VLLYGFRVFASLKPVSQTGVVVNYVNPGLCHSELTRNVSGERVAEIEQLKAKFARTTEVGSRTLVHGAIGGKDTHGKYLSECEIKE